MLPPHESGTGLSVLNGWRSRRQQLDAISTKASILRLCKALQTAELVPYVLSTSMRTALDTEQVQIKAILLLAMCRSCWISAIRWACLTAYPLWQWPPTCVSCTALFLWTHPWRPISPPISPQVCCSPSGSLQPQTASITFAALASISIPHPVPGDVMISCKDTHSLAPDKPGWSR